MEVILGGIFMMLAAEQLAPLINFWANLSMFCSILWIRNLLQNTFYNIVLLRFIWTWSHWTHVNSVWPDWPIILLGLGTIFYKLIPNIWELFGLYRKTPLFIYQKLLWLLLEKWASLIPIWVWESLSIDDPIKPWGVKGVYMVLIQHLVALATVIKMSHQIWRRFSNVRGR